MEPKGMKLEPVEMLSMAVRKLAGDALMDEYGTINIVTAIYALASSVQSVADAIREVNEVNKDAKL